MIDCFALPSFQEGSGSLARTQHAFTIRTKPESWITEYWPHSVGLRFMIFALLAVYWPLSFIPQKRGAAYSSGTLSAGDRSWLLEEAMFSKQAKTAAFFVFSCNIPGLEQSPETRFPRPSPTPPSREAQKQILSEL